MSRAVGAGELKALVRQLVTAVGGVEAAGVELGVSHQRVSQLQSPNHPEQMSFLQIAALEAVVGRPIVTGAAARAIAGESDEAVAAAAVENVGAAAVAVKLVHEMDADGRRDAAEIRQVQRSAQESLRQAQELADATARLTPGEVA